MWRTARGAGLDATSAEDVVQTVWMVLLRSADTIRDDAHGGQVGADLDPS